MNALTLNLNLNPGGAIPPKVHLSQYDNILPTIEITLYEGTATYTIPSGALVYVAGTKADDTGFEYACSFSGSVVTVVVTEQMTAFAGIVPCELIIYVGDERKGTANFQLAVEPAALSDDTIISETDIPIIQQIPTILADVTEAGETAVSKINTAKADALDEMEDLQEDAEAWAVGERGGVAVPTTDETYHNNSKYYAEQARQTVTGAVRYIGSIYFASIPTSGMIAGDMYDIKDAFTTDARFEEGAGIDVPAGSDIVYGADGKWDVYSTPAPGNGVFYGNSATAAGTAAKVVTTTKGDFTLYAGADVIVKFANADTAGNITLNVDETGAVAALLEGSAIGANFLNSDTAYEFVYDGTNFLLMNGGGTVAASSVSYDNTTSGLSATTAQGAIDEVIGTVNDLDEEKTDNTNLGTVELTTTATAAHAVGTYFILGGQFVKTTVAIGVGDTITVGTNATATDIGSVLTELNSKTSFGTRTFNCTSKDDFETQMVSYASGLSNTTANIINVGFPSGFAPFNGVRALGFLFKATSQRWNILLTCYGLRQLVNITYVAGTFEYIEIS